jgi:hypothetical protein
VDEGECVTNLGGPVSHELVDHDVQEVCAHTYYFSIFTYCSIFYLFEHILLGTTAHACIW